MANTRVIGLEVGTSTSVIRVKIYDGKGDPVDERLGAKEVIFTNQNMVPTLVQRLGDISYYGHEALVPRKKGKQKAVLHMNFKMKLDSDDPEEREEARRDTKEFLSYLAETFREQSDKGFLGSSDCKERTIVSYPVKWGEDARNFILEAAQEAGFKNVEGITEAQAAVQAAVIQSADLILSKGYIKNGKPLNILLIDMGAGTTDLVLCRFSPWNGYRMEILSTWPETGGITFGGSEVDELLRNYIRGLLPEEYAEKILARCGIDTFKAWKEHIVSSALKQDETVTEFSELDAMLSLLEIEMDELNLDRKKFETLFKDYLCQFAELVNGCIRKTGLAGLDVDLVVLTGGHSQWYFVKEILLGNIIDPGVNLPKIRKDPERIISFPRPQEIVALGSAYVPMANAEMKKFRMEPSSTFGFSECHDVISISCSDKHVVCLHKDGSVGNIGNCVYDQGNSVIKDWDNIVAVSCGYFHTVGLKKDGSVVAAGDNQFGQCDVKYWHNIIAIACGNLHTVGLKKDGSVVATGNNRFGQCNVQGWRDISAIASSYLYTVGLKKDGSVVATGSNQEGSCNVATWDNIIEIACHETRTIGWRKDGSILTTKDNYCAYDIENRRDIVVKAYADSSIAGLREDGRLVLAGAIRYYFLNMFSDFVIDEQ